MKGGILRAFKLISVCDRYNHFRSVCDFDFLKDPLTVRRPYNRLFKAERDDPFGFTVVGLGSFEPNAGQVTVPEQVCDVNSAD